MLAMTTSFNTAIASPVRKVQAKVEVYNSTFTLVATYSQDDALQSFEIQRVGESKFFGFGFCQRLNVKLRDVTRDISITTDNKLKVYIGINDEYAYSCFFNVSEARRDENTNQLSITAYDDLYEAGKIIVPKMNLNTASYDVYAQRAGELLKLDLTVPTCVNFARDNTCWLKQRPVPNYEGTETVKDILDDIAEASQTIYYMGPDNEIVFKRLLGPSAAANLTIGKADYFTLKSGDNRRLQTVIHATELGDNVKVSTSKVGSTQCVRDNAWWENATDIAATLDEAIAIVGDFTINQFECVWRGNPALEIGDKIAITTKDNSVVYSYLLDDTIEYDGTLSQKSKWSFSQEDVESATPNTVGEVIKQTFAKVDKVNKQIDLVVSESSNNSAEVAAMKEQVSQLTLTTDSVNASVSSLEQQVGVNQDDITTIKKEVEMMVTDEDLTIAISQELANGVNQVTTATGYTFNADGLTIERSDSEITTTITQDGMSIKRGYSEVLTANNEGVKAEDLHATTYLIIGENSRFEDYKDGNKKRTGCFWIGG